MAEYVLPLVLREPVVKSSVIKKGDDFESECALGTGI